ncbi:potassium voltage-gated channel subfamily H member 4 [Lates japonicus]|uniref:Potassium voltage-gated channel subfamily H member 4 n=1 Tax=Lates japonicus TaxID=270547 RepID=A0AAD3RJV0_LATJO|nr:potassium voltage-gated channel subfamily H member 4 [Lates japonicus]
MDSQRLSQPRLSTLLGEELRHISALRLSVTCSGGRGRSPLLRRLTNEELSPSPLSQSTSDPGRIHRACKAASMPSLPWC